MRFKGFLLFLVIDIVSSILFLNNATQSALGEKQTVVINKHISKGENPHNMFMK